MYVYTSSFASFICSSYFSLIASACVSGTGQLRLPEQQHSEPSPPLQNLH